MTAWVEMGLQEGSRGPGWYNGYNVSVLPETMMIRKKTKEAIRGGFDGYHNSVCRTA